MRSTLSSRLPRLARRARRAFTLLEILVVLAIIGLLATLAIQNLGGTFEGARVTTAQLWVTSTISTPLNVYRFSVGDFPSTSDGLQALITKPGGKSDGWRGPYLEVEKVPTDPWGEPYQYAWPGKRNKSKPDVWSKGPDKQDGTADDIGNWDSAPAGANVPK
ncbi:MAG: type secretion system protein GspG [Verrucomicrobiota bacterium]|jgi:general secretion pathway protein G